MKKPVPIRRKRLAPHERRQQIVEGALSLFAERGFDANTRELAVRLKITQPLLYRYFPAKEDLIEAVFELAYQRLARIDWLKTINGGGDLRTRLITLWSAYATSNYDYEWIRLYMFAGLAGGELNRRYIRRITLPLLKRIAEEVRLEIGRPASAKDRISDREIEYLWLFHGGLYYGAIREHIYAMPMDPRIFSQIVELSVDTMISGYRKLLASNHSSRSAA